MKKLIVSTMLLAGVSFGFAKGYPIDEKNSETTNTEFSNLIKKHYFLFNGDAQKLLIREMCLDVYYFIVNDENDDDGFRVDGPYEVSYPCDNKTISIYIF